MVKNKLKCAVITPYRTGNIGTILQAYATQKLIEGLGYEVDIVDFTWKSIENPFLFSNLLRRGLKNYLSAIAGHLTRLPRKKALEEFVEENLSLTKPVDSQNLKDLNSLYDFFLVGSDCVWNSDAFGMEKAYFLDFVIDNRKKGNYASSFACDEIPQIYRKEYELYLKQFRFLSVREKRGQELIRELIDAEVPVVLDPTLLCNSGFWSEIAEKSALNLDGDYIFVAEYSISAKMLTDAQELAKKYNCKIICAFPPKGKRIKASVLLKAGPCDFMFLIKNARFVLTDSYHMTIFSINFNVPFLSYITNTVVPSFSKYESILTTLGLMNRVVYDNDNRSTTVMTQNLDDMDFESVNEILKHERIYSMKYLANQLNEINMEIVGKK